MTDIREPFYFILRDSQSESEREMMYLSMQTCLDQAYTSLVVSIQSFCVRLSSKSIVSARQLIALAGTGLERSQAKQSIHFFSR